MIWASYSSGRGKRRRRAGLSPAGGAAGPQGNLLGPEHLDTAGSHSNLSLLLAELGEWSLAADEEDKARHILCRQGAGALADHPEREQLLFWYQSDRRSLQTGLSLGWHEQKEPSLCALSAGWLLNGKARALDSLSKRIVRDRDRGPEVFINVSSGIDPAALAASGLRGSVLLRGHRRTTKGGKRKRWVVASACCRRPRAPKRNRGSNWTRFRHACTTGCGADRVARFSPQDAAAKGKAGKSPAAHYAAWMIPPAGTAVVRIVDLGDADTIDRAPSLSAACLISYGKRRSIGRRQTSGKRSWRRRPPNWLQRSSCSRFSSKSARPSISFSVPTRHYG